MFCLNCGNELKESSKFCSSCGHEKNVVTKEKSESNEIYEKNGTIKSIFGAIIGFIVFVISFVVVGYLVKLIF